jgi:hypothetical protein
MRLPIVVVVILYALACTPSSTGLCDGPFCVSWCQCGDRGCPFTEACPGSICPLSCPSGEVCADQPGGSLCSPTCTPGSADHPQGSCEDGMTCETLCT